MEEKQTKECCNPDEAAPAAAPPLPEEIERDAVAVPSKPARADREPSLLLFDNPDKVAARPSGEDGAMPLWPFRLLLAGPPGVGKRNMLLNLAFRLNPRPSSIHIVHVDPETPEYEVLEELGVPMYYWDAEDFPTVDDIANPPEASIGAAGETENPIGEEEAVDAPLGAPPEAEGRSSRKRTSPLVVIDEITSELLSARGRSRLERLMNFGSTHRNVSVCYSIQAVTNVPPKARRAFNQFCLWNQPDTAASAMAATRAGIPPAMLQQLFELCYDRHDSIWIDCDRHPDSEFRFRLNFLTPITATDAVHFAEY